MPAGYRLHAASPADFLGSGQAGSALIIESGIVTVWQGFTGAQVTDLLDSSEDPATQITADSFGNFRFWAPDTLGTLTVSSDGGTTRYVAQPSDVGDQLAQLRADVAQASVVANDLIDPATGLVRAERLPAGTGTEAGPHTHPEYATAASVSALSSLIAGRQDVQVMLWDPDTRTYVGGPVTLVFSGFDSTADVPQGPGSGRAAAWDGAG